MFLFYLTWATSDYIWEALSILHSLCQRYCLMPFLSVPVPLGLFKPCCCRFCWCCHLGYGDGGLLFYLLSCRPPCHRRRGWGGASISWVPLLCLELSVPRNPWLWGLEGNRSPESWTSLQLEGGGIRPHGCCCTDTWGHECSCSRVAGVMCITYPAATRFSGASGSAAVPRGPGLQVPPLLCHQFCLLYVFQSAHL